MMTVTLINAGLPEDAFSTLCDFCREELPRRGIPYSTDGDYRITVGTDAALTNDAFRLTPGSRGALVAGASVSAVFHGTGYLLRQLLPDGTGGWRPLRNAVTLTPQKPLRGIYFATHFRNFYHAAPLEEVYRRVVLSATRGYNALLVWFDMHHFRSMTDPEAMALSERLHSILKFANRCGMGASLLMLANEGFASTPLPLRAHFAVENGYHAVPTGHYGCEICPSVPGGVEEILRQKREVLAAFADLRFDSVILWPYDQGGCTCSACAPWGGNGYLRLLPHCIDLIQSTLPESKIILSTWFFDHFTTGEWDAFFRAAENGTLSHADCLMATRVRTEYPGWQRFRWVSFPEISMLHCAPWGGYGASILTDALQAKLVPELANMSGGFPYSEGIFEDANEFLVAGLYTGEFTDTHAALRAYAQWEFCCAEDALVQAMLDTEKTLPRTDDEDNAVFMLRDPSRAERIAQTLEDYNRCLTPSVTSGTAFRLLYLRAVIDRELVRHGGDPFASPCCVSAMEEVDRLYHVTNETSLWVRTPVWRLHPDARPEHTEV